MDRLAELEAKHRTNEAVIDDLLETIKYLERDIDIKLAALLKTEKELADFKASGLTPERCAELAKADQEGQLVSIEIVRKELKAWLIDACYCTRDWSAWSCGTMSEDDFKGVDIEDIVQSIIKAGKALESEGDDEKRNNNIHLRHL